MGRLEGDRCIKESVGTSVVRADLVTGGTVRCERPGHRRWSPLAVVAVAVALPLVDAVGEGALEVLRRVGQPKRCKGDLDAGRGAPVLAELVGKDALRVVDDRDVHGCPDRWRSRGTRCGAWRERRQARHRREGRAGCHFHGLVRQVRRRPDDESLDLRDQPLELVAGTHGVGVDCGDPAGRQEEADDEEDGENAEAAI